MNDRLKTLSRGIIDVSPLMIPVVPFGIIYGVIGMELGLSAYMTFGMSIICLLYTSPSPRDVEESRMPSSA